MWICNRTSTDTFKRKFEYIRKIYPSDTRSSMIRFSHMCEAMAASDLLSYNILYIFNLKSNKETTLGLILPARIIKTILN